MGCGRGKQSTLVWELVFSCLLFTGGLNFNLHISDTIEERGVLVKFDDAVRYNN